MSRNRGIGIAAALEVADQLLSEHGSKALCIDGDVPVFLRCGRRNVMLGRYLRSVIREAIGMEDSWPEKARLAYFERLRVLREDAPYGTPLADLVKEPQKSLALVKRSEIFNSVRSI